MITFEEAYKRLSTAYLQDEVIPTNSCACFVGNLLNGKSEWCHNRIFDFKTGVSLPRNIEQREIEEALNCIIKESDNTYTYEEILHLETVFMAKLPTVMYTEEELWDAFNTALDVLADIHRFKGQEVNWSFGALPKRKKKLPA